MLSSDQLASFIAFAEHLNFTHAARALHLSQPALHVQITRLGEAVGSPLYRRIGRRLELTSAGDEVLAFARQTREREAAMLGVLRTGDAHSRVTLAAGEGSFLYLLGPAIRAFTRASPAPLSLLVRDRVGTVAAVRTGEAHLGVAVIDAAIDGLDGQLLARVPQVLVVPARHRLATRRRVELADLDGAKLIVPPEGQPHRAAVARALRSAGVEWSIAVEANGWELMLHFAAMGVGLAIVNGCCRIPRGLVARPLAALPELHYHVLQRPGAVRGAAATLRQALLDHRTETRPPRGPLTR
jgi:DNA-binding transcriptional LysR family regulator